MLIQFAEAIRALLVADAAFNLAVPGGVHAELVAQSNAGSRPVAVWTGPRATPFTWVGGWTSALQDCSIELKVVCDTVAQAKTALSAIQTIIEANQVKVSSAGVQLNSLRITEAALTDDDISDGNDEPLRVLTVGLAAWVC
jgi:hypothetical protein